MADDRKIEDLNPEDQLLPSKANEDDNNKNIKSRDKTNKKIILGLVVLAMVTTVAIFGIIRTSSDPTENLVSTTQGNSDNAVDNEPTEASTKAIDLDKIPLGDDKYGTSPKVGYIYSCLSNLNGPGAFKDGPWIHADEGYWSKAAKNITVDGDVKWSNATFKINKKSQTRELVGNGLPLNHGTGIFPVQTTDDAFSYDRNPNSIQAQNVLLSIPLNPSPAGNPTCLPMGEIGYSVNGVAIYNALDAGGRDAAAHEIQDNCNGHPERTGEYHYHDFSECISQEKSDEPVLIGYAMDGFGIYKYPTNPVNKDLDVCHGKTGKITWDGKTLDMYHYVVTTEYPYTVGCFKAQPS